MTGPALRTAGHDDAADLARIHAAAFAEGWSVEDIARLLEAARAFALVAEDGDGPFGFALGWVPADEAEIITLAVLPDRRRAGAGRALLTAAMGAARVLGATAMFLDVDESNVAALSLYRSLGFGEVGRRPRYYKAAHGERRDALVLKRGLLDT